MGRRARNRILAALGGIVLVLLLLFYTSLGLGLVGRLAGLLAGGTVRIEGLGGLFPNRLHADKVEIADDDSTWLRLEQVSLTWSALAMINDHVSVREVSAARVIVLRRPLPSRKPSGKTPRLDIGHLVLNRIELAAPVIGHAVMLSASAGVRGPQMT